MIRGGKVLPVGQTGTRSYYYRVGFADSQIMLHNGSTTYKMLSADNPVEPYESQLFCDYSAGALQDVGGYKLRSFTWVARIVHNFNRLPAFSAYDSASGYAYSGTSTAISKFNNKNSNNAVDIKFPGTYVDTAQWVGATITGATGLTETLTTTAALSASDSTIALNKTRVGSFVWVAKSTKSWLCIVTESPATYTSTGQTVKVSKIFTTDANTTDSNTESIGTANGAVKLIPMDTIKYTFVTVA